MPGRAKGIHPLGVPIVSTVRRAADVMRVDPGQLADAVARAWLQPWGADGTDLPVWRWAELVSLAQQLGGQLPPSLAHHYRQYEAAHRGRANRAAHKRSGPGRAGR